MTGRWLTATLPLIAALAIVTATCGAQEPTEKPGDRERIDTALRLTQAAASEYEIRVGVDRKSLVLQREPILRWSNPSAGEIHGNVFLWTRGSRPLVVASLHKWFSPHTHMSHEFHSLAGDPLGASFHGKPVWKAEQSGVHFTNVPEAAAPGATETQRLLQMKQLAKEFAAHKKERDSGRVELRLLPQPVHRYAAPKEGVINGGLFAFVHGTDPEVFLLIEARGDKAESARWKFAATRMNSVELHLRHRDKEVWSADVLTSREVYDHAHPYTNFFFKEVPEFLKDALPEPKP